LLSKQIHYTHKILFNDVDEAIKEQREPRKQDVDNKPWRILRDWLVVMQ